MEESSSYAMSSEEPKYMGDMTTVARRASPTEANLLKNMLIAAGIPAVVADANLIQADSWMANAYGGVRVMVRAAYAEDALATIQAFESGLFQLPSDDDEDETKPAPRSTDLRLWGSDIAAFWSLFLTPVFGSLIHYLNSRTLQHRQVPALLWLLASLVITVTAMYFTFSKHWDPMAAFQVSAIVSGFTFIWYVFSGRAQSSHITQSFGSRYVKRPLFPGWIASFITLFLIGFAGEVLA